MKIKSLQISNIISFKHYTDISDAEKIMFDEGLNIIIGENGAGKSTALEIINFLFKRVLYKQFNTNQDFYNRKDRISYAEKRNILTASNSQDYSNFRLEPNWNTPEDNQTIRLCISLDAIDLQNIKNIQDHIVKLNSVASSYTTIGVGSGSVTSGGEYTIDVNLKNVDKTFSISFFGCVEDFGFIYLANYNFYKELINLYNLENYLAPIPGIQESFTLIGSYRNYHSFTSSISLRDAHPAQQVQSIRANDFSRSLNNNEQQEPNIFGLVRLRVAEKHFQMISQKFNEAECEEKANNLDFMIAINKKIRVVNLECKVRMIDFRTWQYAFEFFDLKRGKPLLDINSLSAGQKAIIHLVFESYGRGELKGGVIIIDEPEIHLHYQFQNEYLQVIRDLNKEQHCQYILVTHSESLINSSTINHVKRFSRDNEGNTVIKSPVLSADEKTLIKILDNTRSTYAFFAKKVLLVEGDTDRYFFKSAIQLKCPEMDQEIAVLYMGGKNNYPEWSKLFESFGLTVYCIADLDFLFDTIYTTETSISLKTAEAVTGFKHDHLDWQKKILECYRKRIYILRNGDLEHYLRIRGRGNKGLQETISFCNNKLENYLKDTTNLESKEINIILKRIVYS